MRLSLPPAGTAGIGRTIPCRNLALDGSIAELNSRDGDMVRRAVARLSDGRTSSYGIRSP